MPNKYRGICAVCSRTVPKHAGVCTRKAGGWIVLCASHAAAEDTAGVVDTFQTSGGTFYRNRAGRCEDAPCCGCCTI